MAQPFVKWAGGKRKLLDQIQAILPKKYATYHEPMVGGGALFFDLLPKNAILNDLNSDLMVTYEVIRDQPEKLIKQLKTLKNSEEEYLKIRAQTPRIAVNKAARFLYLNKLSFNGLYRVNSSGIFNVPYCKDPERVHFDADIILEASKSLQGTRLTNLDYLQALASVKKKDFVFIDPPYDDTFSSYTSEGFNKASQIMLKEAMDYLNDVGAQVIVCNSDTEFIRNIYKDYKQTVVQDRFVISAKGSTRQPKSTLFITNYTF